MLIEKLEVIIDAYRRGEETVCIATGQLTQNIVIRRIQLMIELKHNVDPISDMIKYGTKNIQSKIAEEE